MYLWIHLYYMKMIATYWTKNQTDFCTPSWGRDWFSPFGKVYKWASRSLTQPFVFRYWELEQKLSRWQSAHFYFAVPAACLACRSHRKVILTTSKYFSSWEELFSLLISDPIIHLMITSCTTIQSLWCGCWHIAIISPFRKYSLIE